MKLDKRCIIGGEYSGGGGVVQVEVNLVFAHDDGHRV